MNQEANNTSHTEEQAVSIPVSVNNAVHSTVEHVDRPQTVSRTLVEPESDAKKDPSSLILPPQVVSKSDLSRSLRELETIDDYFHQAAIRGSKDQAMPTLGKVLDNLASANGLNLLRPEDRATLKTFLARLKNKAPIVHMSFPSEASGPFLAKILEWFRAEVHPHTVLHVGLQPSLVAGCLVRTTNKTFDFSFRKKFEKSKEKLVEALDVKGLIDSETVATEPALPEDNVEVTPVAQEEPKQEPVAESVNETTEAIAETAKEEATP